MTDNTEAFRDEHSQPAISRRRMVVTAVAVVAALAILLSLGTWQVQRLHWKSAFR